MPVERKDWIEAVKAEPAKYLRKGYHGETVEYPDYGLIVVTFECSDGTARKLGAIALAAWKQGHAQALRHPAEKHTQLEPPKDALSPDRSEDPTRILDVLMSPEDPTQ